MSQGMNVHDDDRELLVSWASTLDHLKELKQLKQLTVQVALSRAIGHM